MKRGAMTVGTLLIIALSLAACGSFGLANGAGSAGLGSAGLGLAGAESAGAGSERSGSAGQGLADMTTEDNGHYRAIIWDGRTYVPYCAVSVKERGVQIGIVDGNGDDGVYEYKAHSADEWLINAFPHDGAMLMREIGVTEIPEGLFSEYEWNP